MSDFKVGKTYRYNNSTLYAECVCITPSGGPVLCLESGTEFVLGEYSRSFWKEYKEPEKGKYWVVVYKKNCNGPISISIFLTEKSAVDYKNYLNSIELCAVLSLKEHEWTEGEVL